MRLSPNPEHPDQPRTGSPPVDILVPRHADKAERVMNVQHLIATMAEVARATVAKQEEETCEQ